MHLLAIVCICLCLTLATFSWYICSQTFVEGVDGLPADAKAALRELTPMTYIGNAPQQAKDLPKHL